MYFLILYSCIISPHSFITRFFILTKVEHFSLVSFYNNPSCKKLESLECKWLEDRSGSIALLRWRIFRPELFHHQILPSGNHLKKKKVNLHSGGNSVQLQSDPQFTKCLHVSTIQLFNSWSESNRSCLYVIFLHTTGQLVRAFLIPDLEECVGKLSPRHGTF